jgi:hypothetical protein
VELDEMTRALDEQAETEALVEFALKLMRRSGIVRRRKGLWEVRRGEADRLRYYANSLGHRLGRRWDFSPATGGSASAPAAATAAQAAGDDD